MGAHVLAVKAMGGLCKPRAAFALGKALKEEVGSPAHFHTLDTSGIVGASAQSDPKSSATSAIRRSVTPSYVETRVSIRLPERQHQ